MASTPVELRAPSGLSLTLELYPYGSDTIANTGGDSLTEASARKGLYSATVTESLSGWHTAHVKSGSSVIAVYDIYLEDDTDVHRCEDAAQRLYDGGDGGRLQVGSSANQIDLAGGKVVLQANQPGVTIPTVATLSGSVTLAASETIYPADIQLTIDQANSRDEYTVTWFQNGAVVSAGITAPSIEVVRRSDGSPLIASGTTLSPIGSTGALKYDEVTNRITAGEAVLVTVSATINGSVRTWRRILTRDSDV